MGLLREPRNVDFYIQSKPWTGEELKEFSEIIKKSKAANLIKEKRRLKLKKVKPVDSTRNEII